MKPQLTSIIYYLHFSKILIYNSYAYCINCHGPITLCSVSNIFFTDIVVLLFESSVCLPHCLCRKTKHVATKPKHSKTARNRCIICCMEYIFYTSQQLYIDVPSTEHAHVTTSALKPCSYCNKVINYFLGFRLIQIYSFGIKIRIVHVIKESYCFERVITSYMRNGSSKYWNTITCNPRRTYKHVAPI